MAKPMTQGKEWKQILLFALPLVTGNILQQLYNAVDGIVVGNFTADGENALAAVGTCAPVTMIFLAFALGMSGGCSVVISQLYGARRHDEMRQAVSTSLILVGAMGLALSVVGSVIAKWFLVHILRVPDSFLTDAVAYFSIYCIGLVFQFIYNIVSFILRSLGDSSATLYFLLVSSATNIVLDLIFVAVFHWDVPGVAVATVIAQAVSAVVGVAYMFREYPILRFGKGEFRFHKDKGLLALKLGIPNTLQQCIVSLGNMAVQRLINDFGLTAGCTAALRVENFVSTIPIALNVAMSTFTGQNVGAGKLERVHRGLQATRIMGLGISAAVGALTYCFAAPLAGLFGVEGAALSTAVSYIHVLSPSLLVFAMYFITTGVLHGSGDVTFAAINSLISLGIRCITAYALAYLTPVGGAAVWYSPVVGWTVVMCLAIARYQWGPWRTKAITTAKEIPDEQED